MIDRDISNDNRETHEILSDLDKLKAAFKKLSACRTIFDDLSTEDISDKEE